MYMHVHRTRACTHAHILIFLLIHIFIDPFSLFHIKRSFLITIVQYNFLKVCFSTKQSCQNQTNCMLLMAIVLGQPCIFTHIHYTHTTSTHPQAHKHPSTHMLECTLTCTHTCTHASVHTHTSGGSKGNPRVPWNPPFKQGQPIPPVQGSS